ncbi:hypothetical protein [[Phormidium ambiguum] IAM M-71]|nr:hypothetical protein [Phormidium ambiguum]
MQPITYKAFEIEFTAGGEFGGEAVQPTIMMSTEISQMSDRYISVK